MSNTTTERAQKLKSFGYTHLISFKENIPYLGEITKSFPTVADSVERSIKQLESRGFYDVTSTPL